MADPRLASMMEPGDMPFDGKRMFRDGFTAMVSFQRRNFLQS